MLRPSFTACISVLLVACGGADPVAGDESDATSEDGSGSDSAGGDATTDGVPADGAADGAGDGAAPCPPYHALCGGKCVWIANDPMNCGGCGVTCPPPGVCSAGGCADKCMPGLTACAGRCVDTKTDNNDCGTCGTKCAAGTACVDGACKMATVYPAPPKCADGIGPVISIDTGTKAPCAGDLASTTFTWAVCSCSDLLFTGRVLVDGFDSSKGPYKPGELGAGVGANGGVRATSEATVFGQLWAASTTAGIESSSAGTVHHDLRCGGPAKVSEMAARRDAWVSGSITGKLAVDKTLHISPGASKGASTWGTLDDKAVVTVAPPCSCTPKIPVAAIVAARKSSNDNAAVGLAPDVLAKAGHPDRIDLPCGHYYLTGFKLSTAAAIVVHGRTAIYVDGDIEAGGNLAITLDPKSELDLFVSGTIRASSNLRIGSTNAPALTRVYVGGTSPLVVSSTLLIAGNLWAGNAKVIWESETEFFGAIFAGDFESKSLLQLHYDRAVVKKGDDCPKAPPPPTDAGTPPDVGSPGMCGQLKTTCSSCRDCGNQACIGNACGSACGSSADCCAPLTCVGGCCISPIK